MQASGSRLKHTAVRTHSVCLGARCSSTLSVPSDPSQTAEPPSSDSCHDSLSHLTYGDQSRDMSGYTTLCPVDCSFAIVLGSTAGHSHANPQSHTHTAC